MRGDTVTARVPPGCGRVQLMRRSVTRACAAGSCRRLAELRTATVGERGVHRACAGWTPGTARAAGAAAQLIACSSAPQACLRAGSHAGLAPQAAVPRCCCARRLCAAGSRSPAGTRCSAVQACHSDRPRARAATGRSRDAARAEHATCCTRNPEGCVDTVFAYACGGNWEQGVDLSQTRRSCATIGRSTVVARGIDDETLTLNWRGLAAIWET